MAVEISKEAQEGRHRKNGSYSLFSMEKAKECECKYVELHYRYLKASVIYARRGRGKRGIRVIVVNCIAHNGSL